MMLMAASCPSKRLAAVTNRTGWTGRWSSVTLAVRPAESVRPDGEPVHMRDYYNVLLNVDAKGPVPGCRTSVRPATSPEVEGVSGSSSPRAGGVVPADVASDRIPPGAAGRPSCRRVGCC